MLHRRRAPAAAPSARKSPQWRPGAPRCGHPSSGSVARSSVARSNCSSKSGNASGWDAAWVDLGRVFTCPPVAVSSAQGSLDVFGEQGNSARYTKLCANKHWDGQWTSGENCGSPPAVSTWGEKRLNAFARNVSDGMAHKA
ncbi:hypothetical protein P152DRAFT_15450 [Eremomyces bilateralis CBS 781.70]|uniref:Uncharacterized protein n=1 Tax=Eremomyces bilateralis CBS 781.70 TaxID=1392243 RepID=A0A6G1GHB2_9PEZI|nr:uncharacterized protein P152DRAFT_15450 [Eremomyces bilateralis CBS 781.70]KAF1817326.1 hypothetical protein P152DRAFT_15450 [Eremomyces bilateralis CBS 781.70]